MSKVHKTPIIKIKKIGLNNIPGDFILKILQNQQIEREDILFIASPNDPFFQRYPNLTILNKINIINNSNRTVATFTENGSVVTLNSDCVSKVVGQKNYDTIYKAVCSVFNQTLKLDALMGLLTKEQNNEVEKNLKSKVMSRYSQTDESRIVKLKRSRKRRTRCGAYAVLDNPKPLETDHKQQLKNNQPSDIETLNLIDTRDYFIECDSDLDWDTLSLNSGMIPNLINPQEILESIKYENPKTPLQLIDGSVIKLQTRPEDPFHIATPENLRALTDDEKKKLLVHQAYLHWKHCLEIDAKGNLPLHEAVLENDIYLLKKHCIVMKMHNESVDLPGAGGLSALQMSIHTNLPQCSNILLQFGAKITQIDSEYKTLFHLAATSSLECIKEILGYYRKYPREILSEKEGLWSPDLEFKTNEEISSHLINEFCSLFDDEGFTPLMLASIKGCDTIVEELLKAAPKTVNLRSPLSGDTALHLCISAAYTDVERSDNKSNISQKYLNTITSLSNKGAEYNIPNDSGVTVTTLLGECNEISQILANRVLDVKNKCDAFMLVKDKDEIKVEPMKSSKQSKIYCRTNSETEQQKPTKTNDAKVKKEIKIHTQKTKEDSKKAVILDNVPVLASSMKAVKVLPRPPVALLRRLSDVAQMRSKTDASNNQNNIFPIIIKPSNASFLLKNKMNCTTSKGKIAKHVKIVSKQKPIEVNKVVLNVNNIRAIANARKRKHSEAK